MHMFDAETTIRLKDLAMAEVGSQVQIAHCISVVTTDALFHRYKRLPPCTVLKTRCPYIKRLIDPQT